MQANAVNCKTDKKWIHKQCSDVHGDLSLGVHVDGFRCKRCDGTIPEVNIAENLVVDGVTYWCVKSFCLCGTLLMERIWLLHLELGMD